VSGLRRPEGAIVATRVDNAAPGIVTVHGRLKANSDVLMIGSLVVGEDAPPSTLVGQFVTASGRYDKGALIASTVAPDLLVSDPPAYFGRDVREFAIETFVRASDAGVVTSGGFAVSLEGGMGALGNAPMRAVLTLQRNDDSAIVTATHITPYGSVPTGAGLDLQPAPVPREFDRPGRGFGSPGDTGQRSGPPAGRGGPSNAGRGPTGLPFGR
jgi:hypothetical protein